MMKMTMVDEHCWLSRTTSFQRMALITTRSSDCDQLVNIWEAGEKQCVRTDKHLLCKSNVYGPAESSNSKFLFQNFLDPHSLLL